MTLKDVLKRAHQEGIREVFCTIVKKDGQAERVYGTLFQSGAIKHNNIKFNGPLLFLRSVKQTVASKNTCKQLFLVRTGGSGDLDLEEFISEGIAESLDDGPILKHLKEYYVDNKIKTAVQLYQHCHKDCDKVKYVYRVLRIGEGFEDGLKPSGEHDFDVQADDLVAFAMSMYNHVAHGTDKPGHTGQALAKGLFISTTNDLSVAAWWSHGFIKPVAQIEVRKCNRVWDTVHCEKLFPAHPFWANTAGKSGEFLLEGLVPAEAVTLCTPTISYHRIAYFGNAEMPEDLHYLKPVLALHGSTEALKVEHKDGSLFALKQGNGGHHRRTSRLSASNSHCSAEFFTAKCYHEFGAPVPSAALYCVRMEVDGNTLTKYSLLSEYITGNKLDVSFSSRPGLASAREWAWLDLVMANFDVCGIGYSNMQEVKSNVNDSSAVYRVDFGCNVLFTADGKALQHARFEIDEGELAAFRVADSARSIAAVSNKPTVGWGHKCIKSGDARIKLLGGQLRNRALGLAMDNLDLPVYRKKLDAWMWNQKAPAQWRDMADCIFSRAKSLRALVVMLIPPEEGHCIAEE